MTITLECEAFTSLCPVTGQPDYGELRITYVPGRWLVETKSLKLWLQRWRNERAFNEVIVAQIRDDFAAQIKPRMVNVTYYAQARGGIRVSATGTTAREVNG